METTGIIQGVYGDYRVQNWGCVGIMEKKRETTIKGCGGFWGLESL